MNNITVIYENNQEDAFYIRKKVFMEEQGYQNEFDEIDKRCKYVTIKIDNAPMATGRIYEDLNNPGSFHIGRIAVIKEFRGKHYGSMVLSALEKLAHELQAKEIVLLSQEYAVPFYEKSGFIVSDSQTYYDEGNPHKKMKKIL